MVRRVLGMIQKTLRLVDLRDDIEGVRNASWRGFSTSEVELALPQMYNNGKATAVLGLDDSVRQ